MGNKRIALECWSSKNCRKWHQGLRKLEWKASNTNSVSLFQFLYWITNSCWSSNTSYYRIEEADKIGPTLLWEVTPMATFTFSFKNFNELWRDIYRITYHQWGGASISTRLTCSHPPDCRVRSWLWYVRDPDHNKDKGEEEVTFTTSHLVLIVPTQHSGSTTSNSIYKIYITRGASRVFITFLSCHSCFRYMCNSPAKMLWLTPFFVLWSSNLGIFHLECICSRMRTAFLSRFSLQDSRRSCYVCIGCDCCSCKKGSH